MTKARRPRWGGKLQQERRLRGGRWQGLGGWENDVVSAAIEAAVRQPKAGRDSGAARGRMLVGLAAIGADHNDHPLADQGPQGSR